MVNTRLVSKYTQYKLHALPLRQILVTHRPVWVTILILQHVCYCSIPWIKNGKKEDTFSDHNMKGSALRKTKGTIIL